MLQHIQSHNSTISLTSSWTSETGKPPSVGLDTSFYLLSSWKKKKEEFERAFFGVLFTMIRLSEGYNKLAVFRVILDFVRIQ